MCSSFAHRSPLRRPNSNVKSMVLVAQFGATAVGSIRQEEKTQRAVAASSESKLWIAPPLPHNEMLARTYSASNFGSITPLANQMTALAARWRCACLSISRHSPASTSVPHMTQLVPHLRRGLSARTLTARAMAREPLNSVGTQGDHEPEIVNAPKGLHIWLIVYFAQVSVPPQLGNW